MKDVDLTHAVWRKSSFSSGNGQCVEVAFVSEAVALRDSKDPDGGALVFTAGGWQAFVSGVQAGELHHP